jgi:hypothetical protein
VPGREEQNPTKISSRPRRVVSQAAAASGCPGTAPRPLKHPNWDKGAKIPSPAPLS